MYLSIAWYYLEYYSMNNTLSRPEGNTLSNISNSISNRTSSNPEGVSENQYGQKTILEGGIFLICKKNSKRSVMFRGR